MGEKQEIKEPTPCNVFVETNHGCTFLEMAEKMFSHRNFIQIVMIYQQEFNCIYDVGAQGAPGPKGYTDKERR